MHVHLSRVDGFTVVSFFYPPGGGGGLDCAPVCPICLVGEDAFVLVIQVHLGNCFLSYETREKRVLFTGAQRSCNV